MHSKQLMFKGIIMNNTFNPLERSYCVELNQPADEILEIVKENLHDLEDYYSEVLQKDDWATKHRFELIAMENPPDNITHEDYAIIIGLLIYYGLENYKSFNHIKENKDGKI